MGMSAIAVPITIASSDDVGRGLRDGGLAQRGGADLIEWRIDQLAAQASGPDAAETLVRQGPLPCILTCRSTDEGGAFAGIEAERVGLLDQLATRDAIPAYIDVEYARWIASSDLQDVTAALRARGAKVILSAHDFSGRPENLDDIFRNIDEAGGSDVTKVAWLAETVADVSICAAKIRQRPRETIALCMGEIGIVTRVFAGAWGGLLTFAALSSGQASAPGQPTLEEMITVYRIRAIDAATQLRPVFRQGSTLDENATLRQAGKNTVALALGPVTDEDAALEELRVLIENR